MKNIYKLFIALLITAPSVSFAEEETFKSKAILVEPITLTEEKAMFFGAISYDTNEASISVDLNADTSEVVVTGGNSTHITDSGNQAGVIKVNGANNAVVNVSVEEQTKLKGEQSGAEYSVTYDLSSNASSGSVNLGSEGAIDVNVGGLFQIDGTSAVADGYTGEYTFIANY